MSPMLFLSFLLVVYCRARRTALHLFFWSSAVPCLPCFGPCVQESGFSSVRIRGVFPSLQAAGRILFSMPFFLESFFGSCRESCRVPESVPDGTLPMPSRSFYCAPGRASLFTDLPRAISCHVPLPWPCLPGWTYTSHGLP